MNPGFFKVPLPKNEPVLGYAPGTPERALLQATLAEMRQQTLEIPMYIGDEALISDKKIRLAPPTTMPTPWAIFMKAMPPM
ncbi:MAG: hypothetical protein HC913_09615 [Microscillaceae bacterium]|nr:hypothetical protein [Microscillaceae bacterium]